MPPKRVRKGSPHDWLLHANSDLELARIGKIGDKLWTAIFTRREDAIRIISVRRARKKETKLYAQK
jgi:uncharacterized DUF497 family protein